MTKRQKEELAKLLLDVGKLVLGSLVLGLFQSGLPSLITLGTGVLGLTIAFGLFTMGLTLMREVT